MTRRTSTKNIEIILAIRDLQKMISDTETQEIVNILKQARNALIKIYAEDKEEIIGEKIKEIKKWHFRNTYKKQKEFNTLYT